MTATEIFESVTNGGSSDFALLVQILDRHGKWCLVGGLAVNCYVTPVFTTDADIVVTSSELSSIQAELVASGFEVKEHEHSVKAQMKRSDLRIQFTVDQRYQEFLAGTEVMKVLGEQVSVASLENIVRGKVWAWSDPKQRLSKRKKDELDLIRIAEKYPEVRRLMPPEITNQWKRVESLCSANFGVRGLVTALDLTWERRKRRQVAALHIQKVRLLWQP
ncbi:MAG TPA: hypothetical protein VF397_07705 [Pyrinomonadaceae bacterium]